MKYDQKVHHRKSIRLKNYDYSQAGLYFITICALNRECIFGEIVNDEMRLNDAGLMVHSQWLALPERFYNMEVNEYIMMPNHFHGIMELTVGAPLVGALSENIALQKGQPQGIAPTVGDIVGAFKSITTHEYIAGVKINNWQQFNGKLWQRNFWEHVVRNEDEYYQLAEYIHNNPLNWDKDTLNNIGSQVMEPSPNYGNERCEKIELYEE